MFSEKEKQILRALIEEEITHILDGEKDADGGFNELLAEYRVTLTKMLFRLGVDECKALNTEYSDIISRQLLSGHTTY